MNELHLFAGVGGGILSGLLRGNTCICAVELNKYCRRVMLQRQADWYLPRFPIWDNIKTFDGTPWRGRVDRICGGFPCKGVSTTGPGSGLSHPETALWKEQSRIIREVEPYGVEIENGPALTRRGLGTVLYDLAAMGYDARWGVYGAKKAGAPHKRERMWIVATNPNFAQREGRQLSSRADQEHPYACRCTWWEDKPRVHGVDDGVADRVERLKAIGNGQVPVVAAGAFSTLEQHL